MQIEAGNRAIAWYLRQNDKINAAATARQLILGYPQSVKTLALATTTLLECDHYCEARSVAFRAAKLKLSTPEDVALLSSLLRRFEETETLCSLIERSTDILIHASANLSLQVALDLSGSGMHCVAYAFAEQAVKNEPRNINAWYVLGLLEMFSGRKEQSLNALSHALAIEPRMANAHLLVAMQSSSETAETHVNQMLRALPGIVPGTEAQAYLHYALHYRFHSLNRYEEAWQWLENGMSILRRLFVYDGIQQIHLFEELRRMPLPKPLVSHEKSEVRLIFIVGMFRSGTSLIENMLGKHPDVQDAGETWQVPASLREASDHYSTYEVDSKIVAMAREISYEKIGERLRNYARWRAQGRKYVTEKLPSNFLNIAFIAQALPDAIFLHLKRDPIDTCFSNMRTIFRGVANYAYHQRGLANYYLQYEKLMQHWQYMLGDRIFQVDYSAFVHDPSGQTAKVLDFCGLRPLAEDGGGYAASHVATASSVQVRQPISANRGGVWRNYAQHLAPLLKTLGYSYSSV